MCLQFKIGDHISHPMQGLQTQGASSPLPVLQHFSKCLGAPVRLLQGLLFNLLSLLLLLLQIWCVTLPPTFPFCKVLTRNHISPVIPEFLHTLSLQWVSACWNILLQSWKHSLPLVPRWPNFAFYSLCFCTKPLSHVPAREPWPNKKIDPTFVIQEIITSMSISQRTLMLAIRH